MSAFDIPPPPGEAPEEWILRNEGICMTIGALRVLLEWKFARDHPKERKQLEQDLDNRIGQSFGLLKLFVKTAKDESIPLPSAGLLKIMQEQLDITIQDLMK